MIPKELSERIEALATVIAGAPAWNGDEARVEIVTLKSEAADLRALLALAAKVSELEAALRFYGNRSNWENDEQVNNDEIFDTAMSADKHGDRARDALGD